MKISKMEMVERTYCDVCGRECRELNIWYGDHDSEGNPVDICSGKFHGKSCYDTFHFNRSVIAGDIDFD